MRKLLFYFAAIVCTLRLAAQPVPKKIDDSWKKQARETATRINDLIHTKLELKPDYSKSWVYSKAWITLKPHFYPTDSLTLDAKGMTFNKIVVVKGSQQIPLKYTYDDWQVRIKLDKTYKNNESYTIYIDYTAKPDEFEAKYGADQFLGIKGLYFINPLGKDKDKPTQIWTQGEPESNSGWFPTIDKPNQKTTEELTVTIPDKYVTLSNGKLISQQKNADGTRTDYWKMDLPHAPYLFFLGVGNYAIIKDKYKDKEVNYYVEPEYASVAKKIFGLTPEMIAFYSKITGVDFPWYKYSQITGRDFVAGAMENTTSTLHADAAQQDARQLVDDNGWEDVISHELFHQWFGDYVTTESWSNITLNESFADYGEVLWDEYKYGKDAGERKNYNDMQAYLDGSSEKLKANGGDSANGNDLRNLVRFHYKDMIDIFDQVSYQKGGAILNMLRHYVGDSAFFKALNLYLTTNKFKSAEAQQLRLAFEEVTGRDLNWYFNQWYYGSGHPKLTVDYVYDDAAGKVNVIVKQTQDKLFKLPVAIDIYNGDKKVRYNVWAKNKVDTFTFNYSAHPDLVNFDAEKITLAEKKDNKTIDNYIHQYKYAGNYGDRREAIEFAAKKLDDPKAIQLLVTALNDKYFRLRTLTVSELDTKNENLKNAVEATLATMAKNDPSSIVRSLAIKALGEYKKPIYIPMFKTAARDSSYAVSGNALNALTLLDEKAAVDLAKELNKQPSRGALKDAMTTILLKAGDETMGDKLLSDFTKMSALGNDRFNTLPSVGIYLQVAKNTDKVKAGVEEIVRFRDAIPDNFKSQTDAFINGILKEILTSKEASLKENPNDAALKNLVDYIKSKIPAEEKKGF